MIIEIKDLPEGRKVTRILVDVSFDDSGESQSVSQSFLNETNSSNSDTSNTSNTEMPIETIINPEIKRVIATNPSIPVEMLDMEF